MCMSILQGCMYMWHACFWCPWMSEEDIEFSVNEAQVIVKNLPCMQVYIYVCVCISRERNL